MPPDPPPDHSDDELADRGRRLVAEAVATTRAPHALREQIAAERGRRPASGPRPRRRWSWRILAPGLALVAAAVVAIVLVVGGGSSPTVLAAAQLASRGPALAAPAPDASRPTLLRAEVDGVAFPAWYEAFGWRASGARQDAIEGRATRTVFYEAGGAQAAYTIVAGEALAIPEDSLIREVDGTILWVLHDDGRRVVVWERGGHTCVISAPYAVPEQRLLELAAWNTAGDRRS